MFTNKKLLCVALFAALFLVSSDAFSVGPGDLSKLNGTIDQTKQQIKIIARSVISLAAIGGGIYTFFKVQSDDGGSGKKAIGNFIIALLFGSLIFIIIEAFL